MGEVKYFPAASKEWRNNIYSFDTNFTKNLPIYDQKISYLIKSYFNSHLNLRLLNNKIKPSESTGRKYSVKRIFTSRAEIKHTSSKALITVYTFDQQTKSFIFKLMKKGKRKKNNFYIRKTFKLMYIISNKFFSDKRYKNISKDIKKKILKLMLFKKLNLIFKLNINLLKFKEKFLHKLSTLISRIFRKKIEFRIINLKNFIYNTDIFTDILTLKLKKNGANVLHNMNFIIGNTSLPVVNRIQEKGRLIKSVNYSLLENKYKNINLNSILEKKNLDEMLNTSYYNIISKCIPIKRDYSNIKNILFTSLKYKNMGGIRLEVKGRLTKRYRADRAVFRLRWKGGLKNIDSSYKGLSTTIFRGYENCNVEYSIRASKRRIGSFAVKGWISGK